MNQQALTYWKYTGYTSENLVQAIREYGPKHRFLILEVKKNGEIGVGLSEGLIKKGEGHLNAMVKFFSEIFKDWQACPPPVGAGIIIWLEDGLFSYAKGVSRLAPVVAFARAKSDNNTFLIPDPAYLNSSGYTEERLEINKTEKKIPWNYKRQTLFWRGAASGHAIESDNWKEFPRIKVCLLSKEIADKSYIDAAISKIPFPPEHFCTTRIKESGIVDDIVPFSDFVKYRYQFDADGYSTAWISNFLKLSMRSVLFKAEGVYEQWYYDNLKPWEHYIPLENNLKDLQEKIEWARAHDLACREISLQARELIGRLSFESSCRKVEKTIASIFSCFQGGERSHINNQLQPSLHN